MACLKVIVSVILLAVGLAVVAHSQSPEVPPPQAPTPENLPEKLPEKPSPGLGNWQWSWTLRQRTGLRTSRPRVLQMSRNLLEGKGVLRIDDNWTLTLEGRAHYDPVGRLGFPRSLWIDPRQALVDGRIGPVDLKLGLQQVVWGQADGLRVLDVINPLDYREFILEDFLDSRRPLWMARVELPAGDGRLQLLWIPYFAPGRTPAPGDEFSLGASFGLGLLGTAQSDGRQGTGSWPGLRVGVAPTARPGYRLSSSQSGVRYSRSLGSWDLTANYFRGWEDLPTSYLAGLIGGPSPPAGPAVTPPTLLFAPRYDRREVLGGTAATSLGPLVLRFEAGWNRHKRVAVRPGISPSGIESATQFSGVAGLDYSARPWLWISGQYFLQATGASSTRLLFPRNSHLVSLYLRTNVQRETLRPELFVLTGLDQKQYLIRPRLVKSIGDHWSIGIGADFVGGETRNLFGYLGGRDRAVLELKWMK